MNSLWEETTKLPQFKALDRDKKTDVLIIGGGLAGILCAYWLHQAGVPYVLVEANRICSGITGNTTAKLTVQHGLIYHRLIRDFGVNQAKDYLDANLWALRRYEQLCRELDCDYYVKHSYVYAVHDRGKIERELAALRRLGVRGEFTRDLPLPISVAGAVRYPNQAQFHPLKFVAAIAQGLNIYEHTQVREVVGRTALTNRGRIWAKNMIVATHFPFLNQHGNYFLKLYQHRSYVIALEGAAQVGGMYVDEAQTGLSFRNYGDLLLIGGGGHRTGKQGGGWKILRQFAQAHYPNAVERYHWAAQDCMTLDGLPYIGQYSTATPDVFVATGFQKWGMTTAMVAAGILCDMVQGKRKTDVQVFSPSRSILHPQLAVNGFEAMMGLLTPFAKRCSHMGCALKWNPQERTWDCPCHGSRFKETGDLLDNPATQGLKHKNKR